MTNRPSAANLVARSAAFARSLAQRNPRLLPFRQRGGGAMRAVRPAPLTLLAALALLAILGALFVPDRAQAQAQVLVSNLGQTKTGQLILRNGDRSGQTFSIAPTGGASYYTLSSIEILFSTNGIASTDMGLLTVSPLVYPCVGDECRAPEKSALYADQPGECRGGRGGDVRRPGRLDAGGGQDVCGGGRLQQDHRHCRYRRCAILGVRGDRRRCGPRAGLVRRRFVALQCRGGHKLERDGDPGPEDPRQRHGGPARRAGEQSRAD